MILGHCQQVSGSQDKVVYQSVCCSHLGDAVEARGLPTFYAPICHTFRLLFPAYAS
jgi:hypothetical protein